MPTQWMSITFHRHHTSISEAMHASSTGDKKSAPFTKGNMLLERSVSLGACYMWAVKFLNVLLSRRQLSFFQFCNELRNR